MFTTQTCSIFFDSFDFKLDKIANEWEVDQQLLQICYQNIIKGKSNNKPTRFFQATCSMILQLELNKINIKLSRNGTVQLTGCRRKQDAFDVFNWIWNKFDRPNVSATIIWSMTNINVLFPFTASKYDIANSLRQAPIPVIVINEPAYPYSGLFFKIPVDSDELGSQKISRIICESGKYSEREDIFLNFVNQLSEIKRAKKLSRHYVCFTLFSSGKCNVSGIAPELTQQKIDKIVSYLCDVFGY